MTVLNVPVFGGGIVLEGSADAQRTDELSACDGYDIGPRGQLVASSDLSNYADATGGGTLNTVFSLEPIPAPQLPQLIYVGDRAGTTYIGFMGLDGSVPGAGASPGATHVAGWIATFAQFPYVLAGVQLRLVLVAIAARAAFDPRAGLGLFVVLYNPAGPGYQYQNIDDYDALGTGAGGEAPGGTHAKPLFPRIVLAYNNHALLAGFDDHDATSGDGPNRVMFSNIGNPLKYGLDPAETDSTLVGTDRAFTDSDAVTLGGVGCVLRAGLVWNGRAWFGANNGLHYLEGFGRESFKTNGALAVVSARNVVGPRAMIEGPDRLLHCVGDTGHWIFDGGDAIGAGDKLRDYNGRSLGYWDCIWTDASRSASALPGSTNQDLVWMLSDDELGQVLIGIPFCSAAAGYGAGSDTVVLKYHVATGGYTRQVFTGKQILSAVQFRREHLAARQRYWGGKALATNVMRYRYRANASGTPALPAALPDVTFGEYAPFGPAGVGVMRKKYLTLSWQSGALPLVFALTPIVDGQQLGSVTLSIQSSAPGTPADGDLWVDTSGTDTNLGNGTAGAIVRANAADYLVKQYRTSWAKWVQLPLGGQQGTRVSLPVYFDYARGTRFKVRLQCTAAADRFQIEDFGDKPAIVTDGR